MSLKKRTPTIVRVLLTLIAVGYLLIIVGLPVGIVFKEAFAEGWDSFKTALTDAETIHALKLTLTTCAIVVPLNTIFGLAMAWVLARQQFFGRSFAASIVQLPLAMSPTVAGLFVVLVYSPTVGLFNEFISEHQLKILFATPGIVIVTLMVTLPLVALEVIPSLERLDRAEEQAAATLGATGWQTFWRVVFPSIRWSLVYGIVLCSAKAAGEFGAVSNVSGKIPGETNTLTLHIQYAYEAYETTKAFTGATLLTGIAIVTLLLNLLLPKAPNSR